MALFWTASQVLKTVLFTGKTTEIDESKDGHQTLPLIRSPVDPKAYAWLRRRRQTEGGTPGKIRRSHTVAEFESEHKDSKLAGRLFRKQEAASSLELFFDLFFVANLAVFTTNHEQVDANSVTNYIGFFSIIWFTWFHISIYDVRFYADSMFLRLAKMIHFGVMTAFVGLGPVYDSLLEHETSRSFEGMGLVQMLLRFVLVFQYAAVLYFVKGFHKTLVPLCLMMGTYLLSGFAFLAVSLVGTHQLDGAHYVYRWYIILGLEGFAVMIISCVWRVMSFKHTHVHERVGLLTLIVLGEGIIGMLKSCAYVLGGTSISIWSMFGIVASATTVIYFIYLLYFENIEHHRFGSIMQQVWLLLHFMLHLAIVLAVEGQSSLIRWFSIRSGVFWLETSISSLDTTSTSILTTQLNDLIKTTEQTYHAYPLKTYYDPTSDLKAISSSNSTSNLTTSVNNISYGLQYFIYKTFYAEGSEEELYSAKTSEAKVDIYNDAYGVIFEYYYISAGVLLVILAIMNLIGRKHFRWNEVVNPCLRFAGGVGLACVCIVEFLDDGTETSLRFSRPGGLISIVSLVYFAVLWLEGLVNVFAGLGKRKDDVEKGVEMKSGHDRAESIDHHDGHYGGATGERGNGYAYVGQEDHDEHGSEYQQQRRTNGA